MLPVMGYFYDNASQPTGINYTLGLNTLGNLTYAYDLAGRRTGVGGSYARTGVPAAASSATYNVNNQLTNWKGAALTYDANGNLTSDGTNTYTWNARNQLVTISGAVNASFQYDAFGRRVSKTIGGTTQFLYDGANPVQEISNSSASANLITGGVDEYFQRTDSAGARSFMTDALGSTLALADSTGTVQTFYTFEPFGNTTVAGSSTTNSFAFTGRELDATGLYFYRARYYNPSLQRFISEDPLRFSANSVNFYELGYEDPTNHTDPFGQQPMGLDLIAWFARQSPCTQARIVEGVQGLVNLGVGVTKIVLGAGLTTETGGLAIGFGGYLVVNGLVTNIGGGTAQIMGAITGDIETGEMLEQSTAATGSVFGLAGFATTGGNLHTAAQWSRLEPFDFAVAWMSAGGEIGASEILDIGVNSAEGVEGAANWNPCKEKPKDSNLAGRKPRK